MQKRLSEKTYLSGRDALVESCCATSTVSRDEAVWLLYIRVPFGEETADAMSRLTPTLSPFGQHSAESWRG